MRVASFMLSSFDPARALKVAAIAGVFATAAAVDLAATWVTEPDLAEPVETATVFVTTPSSRAHLSLAAEKAATVGTASGAATPGSGDRRSLARAIQHELVRAGCYDGRVSGVWSGPTRRAMRQFTERVNASLPVGDPDPVLLALLRSHSGTVCGGVEVADARGVVDAPPTTLTDSDPDVEPRDTLAELPEPERVAFRDDGDDLGVANAQESAVAVAPRRRAKVRARKVEAAPPRANRVHTNRRRVVRARRSQPPMRSMYRTLQRSMRVFF